MKNPFWKSKNFWANMLRLVLLAFTIGGAVLNPDDAFRIVDTVSSGNVWAIVGVLGISLVSPIISFVKNSNDAKKLLFLRSTNFWNDVLNFILGTILMSPTNLVLPPNAAPELINYVNQGAWATAIAFILSNIVVPIIHIFTKKPETFRSNRSF